jgi:ABC-type branched-subunit amino acid transport system ATPase component
MLSPNNIEVVYDGIIPVSKRLACRQGRFDHGIVRRITALGITMLKAITGVLAAERGQVTKAPSNSTAQGSNTIAGARGCEARRLQVLRVDGFENLTVERTSLQAAMTPRSSGDPKGHRAGYDLFQPLKERRNRRAAIFGRRGNAGDGCALMSDPKAILLDEPGLVLLRASLKAFSMSSFGSRKGWW